MPAEVEVLLAKARRLARRDEDLLADEVDPGDELGDGVLDLDARVHLEEPVVAFAVEQPLDRACAPVAHRASGVDRDLADALAEVRRHRRRGCLLDELLVPPLDGAVPLAEVEDGSVAVGEHLDLDVARVGDELLDVDRRIGEVGLALALRGDEGPLRLPCGLHHLEALPAASGRCLDRDGPAELVAQPRDLGRGRDRLRRPRERSGRLRPA